jgi:hypothetical protein
VKPSQIHPVLVFFLRRRVEDTRRHCSYSPDGFPCNSWIF